MRQSLLNRLLLGTALCAAGCGAFAASAAPTASDAASGATADQAPARTVTPDVDSLNLEEIVVTGVNSKTTKFQTSYGLTTINSDKQEEIAPQSSLALMSEVPGVWAESTGGETSGNLYVRGLPSNGGEKFVPLLEDGLPVYQEPEVGFMNADTFFRVSPMTENAEFVRGGPSAVLYSNASAGAFNFITRRGTPDWQGEVGLTYGNYDHGKIEGYLSGPISDKLSFVVGGYYRVDDGQRPPGFVANNGGELKSAVTYRDDKTTASAYLYHLDDRTFFQTDLPFLNASANTDNIKPIAIPGLSLNTGTLDSADFRRESLLTGNGPDNVDLGNGIHSQFDTAGVEIFHDFDNGWHVEERARYTSGSNDFNGMFSGGTEKGTDVLSQIATGPNANPLWTRMLAAYPTLSKLQLVYADNPSQIFNPVDQNGNGLVANQGWWHGLITARDFIDELKTTKSFDYYGQHDLTGGLYFSYANLHTQDNLNFGNLLTDTKSQPDVLNLVGLDASGKVLGSYTYNGFTSFANYLNNVQDETTTYAAFLSDNWKITDALRIDYGIRYDEEHINTSFENSGTTNLQGSAMANGSTALALQSVGTLLGTYDNYSPKFTAYSWTVGGNYEFNDNLAAFLRYSEPQRLPRTEDGWVAANRPTQLTQKLTSLEAGTKVNYDTFSSFVTLYRTQDLAYPNYSYTINGVTGAQTPILFLATTQSYGAEIETLFRPWKGPFDLNAQATISRSTFDQFNQTYTTIDAFGNSSVTSNNYNGKEIPHIPSIQFELRPSYKFSFFDYSGKIFMSYHYAGARYLDNANTFRLPAYDEVSLGAQLSDGHMSYQLNVQNLLNSTGLTEGGCSLCGNTGSTNALGANANVFDGRPLLPRTIYLTARYKF
jgi:outer membrane receptor protein involved in Fe transport